MNRERFLKAFFKITDEPITAYDWDSVNEELNRIRYAVRDALDVLDDQIEWDQ